MALNMTGNSLWWQARLDNKLLKKDAAQTGSIFQTLGKNIGKAQIFAGVAVASALAIRQIIKVNKQFEKSISVLSSITGAVGKDLDFYKDKAIEFGESTTQSATQVANAFKLIGSQKPELLATKEALADVTREAITLAEAAQIDVPESARALTNALNQMNVGAEKAGEFINILAAGSKLGAAEIPYLNAALEKSAAVGRDANLSFAEIVAALEKVAPSFAEPSSAGLHFRTVLLRLQKQGFGFESGMFNLQDALHEVKNELDGIADPVKKVSKETDIFGIRSITMGKALLQNRDSFMELSKEISGTNTAYEQAKINTDNLEGSITRFKSALEGAILKNSDFNDSLKNIVDNLTEAVTWLGNNWEIIEKIIKAYLIYKGSVVALAVAQSGYNKILHIGTLLQGKMNIAMKANVFGLAVVAVYGLVQIMKSLNQEMTEAEKKEKLITDIRKETIKAINKEKTNLGYYLEVARDENLAKETRLKAIKKLNEISPEYLGNITLETINTEKTITAIDNYIIALEKKARAQIGQKKITEANEAIALKEIEIQEILAEANKKGFKTQKELLDAQLGYLNKGGKEQLSLIKRLNELNELVITAKNIKEIIEGLDLITLDIIGGSGGGGNGGGGGGDEKAEYEKALKQFELLQGLEMSRILLVAETEAEIARIRRNMEIQRLQFIRDTNEDITDIERETIDNQILFLRKLKAEQEDVITTAIEAQIEVAELSKKLTEKQVEGIEKITKSLEYFTDIVTKSFEEGEFSARSFGNAVRDAALQVIAAKLAESVAMGVAKLFEEYNPLIALALAAPVGAAIYAVMDAAIPKFKQGKPADFTGGGVVPGTGSRDSELGMFQPDEIVMNPKQQANVLWQIAKGGMSNNKVESLLSEQNDLLRNAKHFIVKDGVMHEVINGRTTARTLLE